MTKPQADKLYVDTTTTLAGPLSAYYGCIDCHHKSTDIAAAADGASAENRARALAMLHDCDEDEAGADEERLDPARVFTFAEWVAAQKRGGS